MTMIIQFNRAMTWMHRICIYQQWPISHSWFLPFWLWVRFNMSSFVRFHAWKLAFVCLKLLACFFRVPKSANLHCKRNTIISNFSGVNFTTGMQSQFTPEQLGVISSSALAYIIFELIVYWITLYVFNISSSILTLDLLAFSGYKFVAINLCILISIIFKGFGYILILGYNSIALFFFLVSILRFLCGNWAIIRIVLRVV